MTFFICLFPVCFPVSFSALEGFKDYGEWSKICPGEYWCVKWDNLRSNEEWVLSMVEIAGEIAEFFTSRFKKQ